MNGSTIKKEYIPIMVKKYVNPKDLAAMLLDDTKLWCDMASNVVPLWVLYPTNVIYDCGKVTNIAYNPNIGWYADVEISADYANLVQYFKRPAVYFWTQTTEDDKIRVDRFIICEMSELDANLYCKGA